VPGGGRPGRGRLRRGRRWSDHRRVRPRDQARDRARDRRRDGGVLRARVLRLSGTANEPPEKAISAAAGSGADERTSREAFRGARGGPGGGTRGRAGAAVGVRAGGTLPPSLQVSPREPATKMQLPPEPVAVQRLPAAYQLPRQDSNLRPGG